MEIKHAYLEYLEHLRYIHMAEEIRDKTKDEYTIKTRDFINYISKKITNTSEIDHMIIMDYLNHKGNAASTKTTTFEIVKHLLRFFEEEFNESYNFKKVRVPKTKKKPPQYLTDKEVQNIFSIQLFHKPWFGIRNKFLLLLLVNSGLRVSEVVNIKMTDIDTDDNFIVVSGKGDKVRYVYYPSGDSFKKYFDEWLSQRPESDYLLCTKKGKSMTTRNVQKIISSIFNYSGIEKNAIRTSLGPHLLRHTFATKLVNKNVNMGIIQELLGHSDISTTTRYAHVRKDSLKRIVTDFETVD